jgi:hypothetical protein
MIRGLLLLAGVLLVLGAAIEPPSQPVVLSPAEAVKQGRELVARILSEQRVESITNTATLKIRDAKGKRTEIPVRFEIVATAADWRNTYQTLRTNAPNEIVAITHDGAHPTRYQLTRSALSTNPAGNETMTPFAGSDFWLADLGLEFFHWPEQRLLRKELRRGQSCNVLESVNPQPAPGAYARVLSWIDIDTETAPGIINADAYDSRGKLLKQFAAKSVKKINGQWELQEIEMMNRQTGSRTSIEYHLGSK